MCVKYRHLAASVGVAMSLSTSAAWGWVEGTIQSDVITVNVERSGEATVGHEIVMKVKGGPFTAFDLEGVDSDAAPLPDATVTSAASGSGAGNPLPLLLHKREDGALRVEIDSPKGIRRGTYLFKLSYRTNLVERNLVKPLGSLVELRWVGPRFNDGLDSARVIFGCRLRRHRRVCRRTARNPVRARRLSGPSFPTCGAPTTRTSSKWCARTLPKGSQWNGGYWRARARSRRLRPRNIPRRWTTRRRVPRTPVQRVLLGLLVAAIAVVYSALVGLKWRAVARACELAGARPRALIPLSPAVRTAFAGTALAAAAAVSVLTEIPTLAGLFLVVAMAFAAHRSPALLPQLRGPGQWLPLNDAEAFETKQPRLPGRWFDVGALPGFALFVVALAGFTFGAFKALATSPYNALLVLLAAACLLPFSVPAARASCRPI